MSALQPEQGAKVTGMCMEMPEAQLLHLLAQPQALAAKVDEAMRVLSAAGYAAPAAPAAAPAEANGSGSPPAEDAPSRTPEPLSPGADPAPEKGQAELSAPPTPALLALRLEDGPADGTRSSPQAVPKHDDE